MIDSILSTFQEPLKMAINSTNWPFIWQDLCGPEGLKVWDPIRHDLGLCFQYLCFDIPVLFLLAISSAYYFGRHEDYVIRGKNQLLAINIRCFMVLLMTLLPILKIYVALYKNEAQIEKIFYFYSAVEGMTWLTHLGYTMALRTRLGLSARGPVYICVLWTLEFVLSVVSLRTHSSIYNHTLVPNFSIFYSFAFSIVEVILQICYGLTLIPDVGETTHSDFDNVYARVSWITTLQSIQIYFNADLLLVEHVILEVLCRWVRLNPY